MQLFNWDKLQKYSANSLFIFIALFLRIIIILFTQRTASQPPFVGFTDIDYLVISDGICNLKSSSVYDRPTYRYSPLLKPLFIFFGFCKNDVNGKIIFAVFDIVNYIILCELSDMTLLSRSHSNIFLSQFFIMIGWLFNPFTAAISIRGSFDSFTQTFVNLSFYFFVKSFEETTGIASTTKLKISALFLGISIHLRIYPIIYLPLLCLFILFSVLPINLNIGFVSFKRLAKNFARAFRYALATISTFVILAIISQKIDSGYLENGLLYHILGRIDHRHNMSIFWPLMHFLSKYKDEPNKLGNLILYKLLKKTPFIFQILSLSAVYIKSVQVRLTRAYRSKLSKELNVVSELYSRLFAEIAMATICFVFFNSVQTMQYTVWWTTPLIVALQMNYNLKFLNSEYAQNKKRINTFKESVSKNWEFIKENNYVKIFTYYAFFYIIALVVWNLNSYLFEFKGVDSSIMLLISNCLCLYASTTMAIELLNTIYTEYKHSHSESDVKSQ